MMESIRNKMVYMGAGVGLVLFALFGLLPGSFIGGVMGLSLSGLIFGTPVEPGIVSRMLIAISMLLGVMVSGLLFVTATSTVGWLIGTLIGALRVGKKEEVPVEVTKE